MKALFALVILGLIGTATAASTLECYTSKAFLFKDESGSQKFETVKSEPMFSSINSTGAAEVSDQDEQLSYIVKISAISADLFELTANLSSRGSDGDQIFVNSMISKTKPFGTRFKFHSSLAQSSDKKLSTVIVFCKIK